jgi:hypothetical protein
MALPELDERRSYSISPSPFPGSLDLLRFTDTEGVTWDVIYYFVGGPYKRRTKPGAKLGEMRDATGGILSLEEKKVLKYRTKDGKVLTLVEGREKDEGMLKFS